MKLHLFNPENDLALGVGCSHYTPPPRVVSLHRAGSLMPAWWAGSEDRILAPDAGDEDLEFLRSRFGLDVNKDVAGEPSPWGWSADACRQFVSAGVSEARLPSEQAVERMRQLSHRRTAGRILAALDCGVAPAMEITDVAELADPTGHSLFLKSPWSCSGRGVFSSRGLSHKSLSDRVKGIIHRQGCVMVEKEYERVRDFAALFESDGESVSHVGWSVFETAAQGTYGGNIVAPQGRLRGMMDCEIDTGRLCGILTDIVAPFYAGPLGIDMMIYRDDNGRERLHPCVEINLRMTMGFVAMSIERLLSPSRTAIVGWEYGQYSGEPLLLPREGFALTLRDQSFLREV